MLFGRRAIVLAVAVFSVGYAGLAKTAGEPPVAVADGASVKRGETVAVLDTGAASVLENDVDPEGDRLTAVLSRSPRRGEVTLNEDGTFIYRHDGSSKNSDEFRYRAFDGEAFSDEGKVRIAISSGDPIAPEIVDQLEVKIAEDSRDEEIRFEDLVVVDPDSDYPRDFTLEIGGGQNYSSNGTRISPSADFHGFLTVPVRVNDGSMFSNWFDVRVEVEPRNDQPFVVEAIIDQEAIENYAFVLSVAENFRDIDEGDSLRFSASGLPTSGSIRINPATALLQGTPTRMDTADNAYLVSITATDSAGASAELTFALRVLRSNRADLAVSSSVESNPTLLGDQTSWNIYIENLGPAQLKEGELQSAWKTSGSTITIEVPTGCTISGNDSLAPELRCVLPQLEAGASISFGIQGVQAGDGDNTLISTVVADDPVTANNTSLVSAQVAIAFSGEPTQTLNQSAIGVATADFNSDSLLDVVASGEDTRVYFNSGSRTLQTPGTTIGSGGEHLALLDWNADGLEDIAVAGSSVAVVRIYLGDTTGSFVDSIEISTRVAGEIKALAAIDVNADGVSELVMAGTFGALIVSNRQSTEPEAETLISGALLDVVVADLDLDGFEDLAVVSAGDRSVNLLRNLQNGSFALQGSIRQGAVAKLNAADLDGDGYSDLLFTIDGDDLGAPRTQLMLRQSDWDFVTGPELGASTASDLLIGDLNADSQLDIVAVNTAGVHQIYIGAAGGQYTLAPEQIVSPGMYTGAVADFNGDDSLDLLLVGANASILELYANNGIGRLGPGDTNAPELRLIGAAVITVPAGTNYDDEGAIASDDVDGDLSDRIVTSGVVNTAVVGTYTITYSVSDRAANTSQATRKVVVGINQGDGGGGGGTFSLLSLTTLLLVGLLFMSFTGHSRRKDGV
jgi:hypothetical protein